MNPGSLLASVNRLSLWRRRVSVWGGRLRAPTFDRCLYLYLHRFRCMGVQECVYFSSVIHAGMHVVDIGANIGLYSLHFSRLVGPAGKVYAFEPDGLMAAALLENIAANGAAQVEVHRCAIGSAPGHATLQRNAMNSGDNRLGLTTGSGLHSERVRVPVCRLDAVLGDRRVDFIKMDVQGWEGEAFRGFSDVVKANPSVRILFEFWPRGLRRAGTDLSDLVEILRSLSLTVCSLDGRVVDLAAVAASMHDNAFTNLIAYRR